MHQIALSFNVPTFAFNEATVFPVSSLISNKEVKFCVNDVMLNMASASAHCSSMLRQKRQEIDTREICKCTDLQGGGRRIIKKHWDILEKDRRFLGQITINREKSNIKASFMIMKGKSPGKSLPLLDVVFVRIYNSKVSKKRNSSNNLEHYIRQRVYLHICFCTAKETCTKTKEF